MILKPWDERDVSTDDVVEKVAHATWRRSPACARLPQTRQGLVRSGGQPLQVVLGGPRVRAAGAMARPHAGDAWSRTRGLYGADADYKETRPQLRVIVDHDHGRRPRRHRAGHRRHAADDARLHAASPPSCARARNTTSCCRPKRGERATPTDLKQPLRAQPQTAALVPLASVVQLQERRRSRQPQPLQPPALRSRCRRGLAPGYPLGEAIDWVAQHGARRNCPHTAQVDFSGQSREYLQAGSAVLFTFGMALLIVFLVLAAQFESFLHPLVIMLTVPLAVLGALLGLCADRQVRINLFSQIGIVMLVGLAAKNGILIVEFANQRRDAGLPVQRGDPRRRGHAPAADPDDLDRDDRRRDAADARHRRRARPAARTIGVVVVFGVRCRRCCRCSWCRRST